MIVGFRGVGCTTELARGGTGLRLAVVGFSDTGVTFGTLELE